MIDLKNITIKKAHEALKRGDFKVIDLVDAYKKVIDEKNGDINAYLSVWDDLEDQAEVAQKKFDDGSATLLTGIPFCIKDIICTKGKVTTGASKILETYKPPYDATVVAKLKDEGAVILGKGNTDEFAQGASSENSAYGVSKNPHDTTRVAGGSSGGPAAAVAMDGALCGLGTDTGGSIRIPASFCGVVGLKPTYGALSRNGLMAMASSFDCPGPMTKTVEDAEIIFDALKGIDPLDSTTVAKEGASSKVKKVGVPRGFLDGVDKDVLLNFEKSLKVLESQGYEVVDIDIPKLEYSLPVYYILIPAEVSSNMARYDGIKYGGRKSGDDLMEQYLNTRGELLGAEVKRRIILGTYVLSAGYADQYYNKALQARGMIKASFKEVFKSVDVVAMPVSPTPAFKIGEKANDPLQMYLVDMFVVGASCAGIPAISIPAGTVEVEGKDLPVGLQLMAPDLEEGRLFEVGKKFEQGL